MTQGRTMRVDETELRLALAEGLLSQEEAERLGEEARRQGRSPLELLREWGRLSEDTFLSLRADAREEASASSPFPRPAPASPSFPVADWERYHCVRFLGQGGMGRVFLARDPRLRRNVALKFVREEGVESTRRFISEARAQARVTHESVCKVYEVGEVQGRVYIAMQYIDGQPFSALAPELTVEQKVLVLRDAARGVHEAHRAGLIHRDLKPSNILVERTEDGALRPYVMDFGLARDWTQELTATGTVLGTPHYMAPEQARGEVATLDRRADVYSLGATLYRALTGEPPIPGGNGLEVLNNIAAREPLPPRARVPSLPLDLEAIVLKCLEKERSARYDSARALAEELERFLSGEPIQARTVGPWYRLRKRLRQHRALALSVSVALLAVLLALGWAGLQRREALERERLARGFTERVEQLEALARYSALSRLHDTRADRVALRARMTELEAEVHQAGDSAMGPGHYALGRGMLALGDDAKAREHLETAWGHGFREPRVAWALALVMGHLYQQQLLEAERLRDPEQRQTRRSDLARRYREPALDYLRQSQGAQVPSSHYVDALLAFYQDHLDEALGHLETMDQGLPWFYEAPKLRGDILQARATRRWNEGHPEQALADFEAGRQAYALAAATGESAVEIPRALGELEYSALWMSLYGQGEVLPLFNQGLAAVDRALRLLPDDYEATVLKARLHRRLAEDLVNHGRDAEPALRTAVDCAQAAVALEPTRARARIELGSIFSQWAMGQLSRGGDAHEPLAHALEAFQGVRPEDQDFKFHMQLGLVHKLLADDAERGGHDPLASLDAAIASYRTALELDARAQTAWASLGIAYLKRASLPAKAAEDDLARAMSLLDKARALNPRDVISLFHAAEAHGQRATQLIHRGQQARPELEQALALYQQCMDLKPDLPVCHHGAVDVLFHLATEAWEHGGDPFPLLARAQAFCEQAIAVAPEEGFGQNNAGKTHAERARYLRARGDDPLPEVLLAEASYREAFKRIPDEALVWTNLAETWNLRATRALGRGRDPQDALAKALEALRQAFDRAPKLGDAWAQLGEARALQARGHVREKKAQAVEFEQAEEAFQKAMTLMPEDLRFRLDFGRFYLEWILWREAMGQEPGPPLERGLTVMEGVLSSHPDWTSARALRACLRSRLEPTRESAQAELSQALALNPNLAHEWKACLHADGRR